MIDNHNKEKGILKRQTDLGGSERTEIFGAKKEGIYNPSQIEDLSSSETKKYWTTLLEGQKDDLEIKMTPRPHNILRFFLHIAKVLETHKCCLLRRPQKLSR